MKKQARRRQHRQPARGTAAPTSTFAPVSVRHRHNGWTPERQIAFVNALAATANVDEACDAVGMSPRSYYDLRRRPGSGSFRQAVDAALDVGIDRLADAMLGRALHGVATPIFYKGEQIGERRRYDERTAMALLRARAPDRYGKWRDEMQQVRRHPDGAAQMLRHAVRALAQDAAADAAGRRRPQRPPLKREWLMDDPTEVAAMEAENEKREAERGEAEWQRYLNTLGEQTADPGGTPSPDVA